KIEKLENDVDVLNEKISIFLKESCKINSAESNSNDFSRMVDSESVRDFSVFVLSKSSSDPVTAIYDYVRSSIRFVDDPGSEYMALPCETILAGGGDCEDHAILLASMLESVGIDAVILSIPNEHTMVGVVSDNIDGLCERFLHMPYKGKDIVIADTTFSNCIGKVSEEYVEYDGDEWDWKKNPVFIDV
ncbi:MAG: transglutaminase domain-containing protein, partial [Candidatus Aenigmarchaeota archaeon]|nr:transglutaminase domain-containing protein [Candidatus Aenigmarchaeota archaeon]